MGRSEEHIIHSFICPQASIKNLSPKCCTFLWKRILEILAERLAWEEGRRGGLSQWRTHIWRSGPSRSTLSSLCWCEWPVLAGKLGWQPPQPSSGAAPSHNWTSGPSREPRREAYQAWSLAAPPTDGGRWPQGQSFLSWAPPRRSQRIVPYHAAPCWRWWCRGGMWSQGEEANHPHSLPQGIAHDLVRIPKRKSCLYARRKRVNEEREREGRQGGGVKRGERKLA